MPRLGADAIWGWRGYDERGGGVVCWAWGGVSGNMPGRALYRKWCEGGVPAKGKHKLHVQPIYELIFLLLYKNIWNIQKTTTQ